MFLGWRKLVIGSYSSSSSTIGHILTGVDGQILMIRTMKRLVVEWGSGCTLGRSLCFHQTVWLSFAYHWYICYEVASSPGVEYPWAWTLLTLLLMNFMYLLFLTAHLRSP